jgi:hypothetical protein
LNSTAVVTRPSIRNLSLAGLAVLGAGALAIMGWRLSDTLLLILAAVILGEGLRPAIQGLQCRGLPFGIAEVPSGAERAAPRPEEAGA